MPKRRAPDEAAVATSKRRKLIGTFVSNPDDHAVESLVSAFSRLRMRASLEDLPEDMLLMIMEALVPRLPSSTFLVSRKAEWLAFFDARRSLYALGRASKYLFWLARPFLCRNICVLRQRSALDLIVHFLRAPSLARRVRNVFVSPYTMRDQVFSWNREETTIQKLKGLQGGLVEWLRPRLVGATQLDHLPNLLLFTLVSLVPRLEQLQLDLGELADDREDYPIEPPEVQVWGYFLRKSKFYANPETMPLTEWGDGVGGAPFLPNPRLRSVLIFHGQPNCSVTLDLSPQARAKNDRTILGVVVKAKRATLDLWMLLCEPELINVFAGDEALHSIDILSEDDGNLMVLANINRFWNRREMVLGRLRPVAGSLTRLRLGFRLTSAPHMTYVCMPTDDGGLLEPFKRLRELVVPTQAWPGPWEACRMAFTAAEGEEGEVTDDDGNYNEDVKDTAVERMARRLPRSLESLRLLEWWSAYAEEHTIFWGKSWILQEQRVRVITCGLARLRAALKRRCPRLHGMVFEAHVWKTREPNVYWRDWLRGSEYGALVEDYKQIGVALRVELDG